MRGFRRSGTATLAATWSTAMACSLLFMFLYGAQIWNDWAAHERTRQGVVEVFMADSTGPAEVEALTLSTPGASVLEIVTKETAKARFLDRFGPEMLNALDSNPLPVSVRIQVRNPSRSAIDSFVQTLTGLGGVESVDSPKTNLDELDHFQSWVLRLGIGCGVLLFAVVFGVIRNSIQLSLRSRDRLIDNMRILGASRYQIEMPFAVEGLFQGLLGGVLASLLPWILLWAARNFLPIPIAVDPYWALRAGLGTLFFAGVAGLSGGWWTVRRSFR